MINVSMQTMVKASIESVWAVIGDFNALPKFVKAAVSSTVDGDGIGSIRTITLPDGAILKEQLEEFDADSMTLKYSIIEGPLPVKDYLSTMKLEEKGSSCLLTWSSTFRAAHGVTDAEAEKAITGVYQMGFDGLGKLFER